MAFSVLDDMLLSGISPDSRIFSTLFRGTAAYKREDLALEACECLLPSYIDSSLERNPLSLFRPSVERMREYKVKCDPGSLYNALLTASRTKSVELLRFILQTADALEVSHFHGTGITRFLDDACSFPPPLFEQTSLSPRQVMFFRPCGGSLPTSPLPPLRCTWLLQSL